MQYILETQNLTLYIKRQKKLDHVNLHVEKGSLYGLVGTAGAGKSLLLQALCNQRLFSGEILINGRRDLYKHHNVIGAHLADFGLLSNENFYHNLKEKAALMKVNQPGEKAEAILQALDLERYAHLHQAYSQSVQAMMNIALSVIGSPDLIVLDEPFTYLSPTQKQLVKAYLRSLQAQNITVLMTSSNSEDFDLLATHYGFLDQGKLVKEIDAHSLKAALQSEIHVRVDDPERLHQLYPATIIKGAFVAFKETVHLNERLLASGFKVYEMKRVKESKDHYFHRLLGGEQDV